MKVIGITPDGKKVVSELGKLYYETGLPLSIIFDKCQKMNVIPSWIHLYDELLGNGMKKDRVIHLLNEHIFESFGKEFRDKVISTLSSVR